jgi:hypothetical protein
MKTSVLSLGAAIALVAVSFTGPIDSASANGGSGSHSHSGSYKSFSHNGHNYSFYRYGHDYRGWSQYCWMPRYNCYGYYCQDRSCWYYYSGQLQCYVPISYVSTFAPAPQTNTNTNVSTNVNINGPGAGVALPAGGTPLPVGVVPPLQAAAK